ncbi:MAG: 3'-5' exonuclease [Bdellovibrionaceae bacterium]|nr:3'-5' exonuclease [Bdellovibrionales bacterium]MCB9085347.1 3'-5' exonuclease [Pseudobdellovibrionaceae bacterium]
MRFIAFDLETTGTLPGVDRIVEIGAVRFVDGNVDAVFSTLVDPRIPIPPDASRVNKITDDMVRGRPTIDRLLEPFADFCGDDVIVAHNAIFDAQFLTSDIKKYESRAPKGIVIDTYTMAKKVYPGLANYRLGTLVQHLSIESTDFHRAEEDATYCGRLFIDMVKKIAGAPNLMPPVENLINLTGRAELSFPQIEPQPKQLDLLDGLL